MKERHFYLAPVVNGKQLPDLFSVLYRYYLAECRDRKKAGEMARVHMNALMELD